MEEYKVTYANGQKTSVSQIGDKKMGETCLIYRLLRLIHVNENKCWMFKNTKTHNGYGLIKFGGKTWRAHRLYYYVFKAEPPKEPLVLCHKCDVRLCVNPEHMFVATREQNQEDMRLKGRAPSGSRNARHKVTEDQVLKIREMINAGYKQKEVADKFGLTQPAVSLISRRINWSHI